MGFRICRPVGDGFGIKHHQIGVITLDDPPALAQAEALRRIAAELVAGVFERKELVVTDTGP